MDESPPKTPRETRVYGHIRGVPVGAKFRTRKELFEAGVHGQIRAGIHGDSIRGAYSVCLSGGYEDDKDFGDKIIYVGSGGQDPNSRKQISAQSFDDPANKSLYVSFLTKLPVRVIRGEDKSNPHAPSSGYRYDGLYVVDSATMKPGMASYNMCFFELNKVIEEGDDTPSEAALLLRG